MKKNNLILLSVCVISSVLVGSLGSFLNFNSIDSWYVQLQKSSLNPPDWVFSFVWFALFICLGVSLYLVITAAYKAKKDRKKYFSRAMVVFILQWLFNVIWSFIFFYLRSPLLALFDITLLSVFIIITFYYFYNFNRIAAYLLIPYFVWVVFATYLNFAVWQLNQSF